MRSMISKWGNSAAIRLSAGMLETVGLRIGQAVDIRGEDGRIIIEPVRTTPVKTEDLVSGITDQNRHGEIDFGPFLGGEIW
ncbi:AbrB/MazE/SpoVT family DNA-binding domain-containing protein [Komagataeibacter europaeus]|uniref:AbrB/MazE/SpoVT family DNA-binding domain-containing protein n=1 Tax=Komagataeibacter europaeus TaxID=33995 RepID=UPI000237F165|nr:AbrB/MazE/SpoVT family DNA-binding domain-containing protein [Komagataeibacter europaeus]